MFNSRKARLRSSAAVVLIAAVLCAELLRISHDVKPAASPAPQSEGAPEATSAPQPETGVLETVSPAPQSETGAPEAGSPSPAGTQPQKGATRRYSHVNLEIGLTDVLSKRTETIMDDGSSPWAYTVTTFCPGATLTVIDADMSDPAYSADGLAHPQRDTLLNPEDPKSRTAITDDLGPLGVTPRDAGLYSLEASLNVFRFEFAEQ